MRRMLRFSGTQASFLASLLALNCFDDLNENAIPLLSGDFPNNACLDEALHILLRRSVCDIDEAVDRVAVVKAGQAQFGNASSFRHKIEGVIQLAAVRRDLRVRVVPPQTVRAFEKKQDPTVLVEGKEIQSRGDP